MNENFNIKDNGFDEIKKSVISKVIPLIILAAGAGLAIGYFNTNRQAESVNVLPFVIPLVAVFLVISLIKGLNQQKAIFESYQLTVNEDEIIREQANFQPISIPRSEIKLISKNTKGTFTIIGASKANIITVPAQINDPEKLEQILAQVYPIQYADKKPLTGKYMLVLVLLTLGLMATVFISKNKIAVGISGTILILFLGYVFYYVQKSKNVDKSTKKGIWWLLFVLLSVIVNMYFKLTGKI